RPLRRRRARGSAGAARTYGGSPRHHALASRCGAQSMPAAASAEDISPAINKSRRALGRSPPPLAAELGFTRVRPHIDWPKSDKSDFGWRDREGACTKIRAVQPPPPPPPQTGEGDSPGRPPPTRH